MSETLFDKLLQASELSAIFGRLTLERALKRARVDPERLTSAELARALPELRRSLSAFVPDRLDAVMSRIEALTRA